MVCDFEVVRVGETYFAGLNPYSIGIWSATDWLSSHENDYYCLNPYSIGIWSATHTEVHGRYAPYLVLILILLEYGLRLSRLMTYSQCHKGLNPYSIGIWSATNRNADNHARNCVLILILLEYGLRRPRSGKLFFSYGAVLILILLEYGLRLRASINQ